MNNVIDQISKKGLCCGCGICAGIVEKCGLKMNFNKHGEFVPMVKNCNNCGLCLTFCPFYAKSSNKRILPSPLGNYIGCFAGYSNVGNERIKGSSGGLATRMLKILLEKGMVDGVIAIGKSDKNDRLFEPVISKTTEEIDMCAGSKYYPLEFSSVLKKLNSENGRYAIVGLPCVVNGLRLAQQRYPELCGKFKYLFGLTCGHNKNKDYASFLINLGGFKKDDVETVNFRCKENTGRAINFGFKGILKNGEETKQLNSQDSLVKDVWCKCYFSLNACLHCHDLFAEQADISFMDAWLKPYIDDPLGTSIVVIRNRELKNMADAERENGNISINAVPEDEVLKSQRDALDFKQTERKNKIKYLINKRLSDLLYNENFKPKDIRYTLLKMVISLRG